MVNVFQTILDVAGTMEVHLHGEDPPKVRIKVHSGRKVEVTMAKVRKPRKERPNRKAAQKAKVSGNKSEQKESVSKKEASILLELFLGLRYLKNSDERYEACRSQKRKWNRSRVRPTGVPRFCFFFGRLKSSFIGL